MPGDATEILVGGQHRQLMTDAELREQRVDRADLHAGATAAVAQFRRVDVILPVRAEERKNREPVDDIAARAGSRKTLQQLLQDEPGGDDCLAALQRLPQSIDLRQRGGPVAAEGK